MSDEAYFVRIGLPTVTSRIDEVEVLHLVPSEEG